MTPKEKSEELFNKYCYAIRTEETDSAYWTNIIYAKNCALIAVDEMISEYQSMSDTDSIIYIQNEITYVIHKLVYWQKVKQEINKL